VQLNPDPTKVNKMIFNSPADGVGVEVSRECKSCITVENTGVYNIQFSAQLDIKESKGSSIDIWLAKSGKDIPWSNTRNWLSGDDAKQVAAWNFVISLESREFIEIYWSSADDQAQLFSETDLVNPTRPGIPSVILTVTQVR
jgi:hypothetical protein